MSNEYSLIAESTTKRMRVLMTLLSEINTSLSNYNYKITPDIKNKYKTLEKNIESLVKEEAKFLESSFN